MHKTTARRLRWTVPVVAGAAVAAAAILPGVAVGSDHPVLPTRSAAQLLADLASVHSTALSGTLVETARLGLPDLPSTGAGSASLSWQNLVTGSHTARIWIDGPQKQRIALVGDLAESDVVHNGKDVWVYASSDNTASHLTLAARSAKDAKGTAQPDASAVPSPVVTPSQAAADAVAAASPTTRISVDATARVAGRAVYQIVLSPKDPASLITSVTIALDSQTKVPLRVQVYGQNRTTPAFETTFTDITFATPPASVFHFIPPTGAQVVQDSSALSVLSGRRFIEPGGVARDLVKVPATGGTHVIGSGWTAVVVTDSTALTGLTGSDGANGQGRGFDSSAGQIASILTKSATKVPQGLLLRTALVSILLGNDGHMYVGAVNGAALQAVASSGHAQ
jgi:outer membrane lipoprotein-sorting protein